MNSHLSTYARKQIKANIAICSNKAKLLFKRMYSHDNLDKKLNDIIDDMPDDKLSWAMTQLQNTLKEKFIL